MMRPSTHSNELEALQAFDDAEARWWNEHPGGVETLVAWTEQIGSDPAAQWLPRVSFLAAAADHPAHGLLSRRHRRNRSVLTDRVRFSAEEHGIEGLDASASALMIQAAWDGLWVLRTVIDGLPTPLELLPACFPPDVELADLGVEVPAPRAVPLEVFTADRPTPLLIDPEQAAVVERTTGLLFRRTALPTDLVELSAAIGIGVDDVRALFPTMQHVRVAVAAYLDDLALQNSTAAGHSPLALLHQRVDWLESLDLALPTRGEWFLPLLADGPTEGDPANEYVRSGWSYELSFVHTQLERLRAEGALTLSRRATTTTEAIALVALQIGLIAQATYFPDEVAIAEVLRRRLARLIS